MVTKKTTTAKKRTPVKRTSKASKPTKAQPIKSFRMAKAPVPFTSFKITRQTVYWVILVSFIIFTQLWILRLQMDVATLTEQLSSEQEM